jgi:hypothetical protein
VGRHVSTLVAVVGVRLRPVVVMMMVVIMVVIV